MIALKPIPKLPAIQPPPTREAVQEAEHPPAPEPITGEAVQDLPGCFTTPTGALYIRNPIDPKLYARYETIEAYNSREALPEYVAIKSIPEGGHHVVHISMNTLTIH